jgi:hypothetical protein
VRGFGQGEDRLTIMMMCRAASCQVFAAVAVAALASTALAAVAGADADAAAAAGTTRNSPTLGLHPLVATVAPTPPAIVPMDPSAPPWTARGGNESHTYYRDEALGPIDPVRVWVYQSMTESFPALLPFARNLFHIVKCSEGSSVFETWNATKLDKLASTRFGACGGSDKTSIPLVVGSDAFWTVAGTPRTLELRAIRLPTSERSQEGLWNVHVDAPSYCLPGELIHDAVTNTVQFGCRSTWFAFDARDGTQVWNTTLPDGFVVGGSTARLNASTVLYYNDALLVAIVGRAVAWHLETPKTSRILGSVVTLPHKSVMLVQTAASNNHYRVNAYDCRAPLSPNGVPVVMWKIEVPTERCVGSCINMVTDGHVFWAPSADGSASVTERFVDTGAVREESSSFDYSKIVEYCKTGSQIVASKDALVYVCGATPRNSMYRNSMIVVFDRATGAVLLSQSLGAYFVFGAVRSVGEMELRDGWLLMTGYSNAPSTANEMLALQLGTSRRGPAPGSE